MIEYITLSDLVKKVFQDAVEKGKEIFNTKKIREKYLNIFEMMNIDRDKLKASDCKQSKDFKIPKDSQKFLIEVYWLYSDADMKKMRKGLFEQASLESIAGLLDGFREMILKLDIPENDKDEMISKMYMRTRYPYLQRRAEVLKELENIKLDFCPDYQDDARVEDELQNYVDNNKMKEMHNISAQRRFRYFDMLDDLDVNDQLLFTSFVLEDIRCMIKRHHELYSYISEIRTCEINDAAEQKALNMTSEEEEYATVDFNYSIKLQEELDKNEEYKDLLLERKEILRSNGFINKLQPRFEAICERLQEIDNETQKKLWGEMVLKDSEDEDIDFSFRDTSENVFQEALKTYCDNNKSRREYEKRMGMITDEEQLYRLEKYRQIVVSSPDVKAREQILEVHARKKRLAEDVDLKIIAKNTSGFSGADLENVLNEAALLSARRNMHEIGMKEIEDAMVKVTMGPEKKTRVRSEKEDMKEAVSSERIRD